MKDDILIVLSSWNWPKNNIMQKKNCKTFRFREEKSINYPMINFPNAMLQEANLKADILLIVLSSWNLHKINIMQKMQNISI